MTFRIRPATNDDFQAIYEMAKLTGGGFTNLPPDKGSLVAKLVRSQGAFDKDTDEQSDDLFVMVLEDSDNGCRAGVAAGAYTVAVPNRHTIEHTFAGAQFVADTLGEPRIRQALGIS